MEEEIKLYRNDSPGGETITDKLAVQEGYSACKKVPNVPVVLDKNIWKLEKGILR